MIGQSLIAAALIGAAPALAQTAEPIPPVHVDASPIDARVNPVSYQGPPENQPREARIRYMAHYIEAVVDPRRGVYILGDNGQWYYARVEGLCPRLTRAASLRFTPSPGGDFDRESTIRADGWRCPVASVVESGGPPRPRRH